MYPNLKLPGESPALPYSGPPTSLILEKKCATEACPCPKCDPERWDPKTIERGTD